MAKNRAPYPAEFRQKMVDLVRSGRSPEELAEEFEPSSISIREWVKKADEAEGRRTKTSKSNISSLSSDEHRELQRLRRENKILQEEKEILKKAAAWFAKDTLDSSKKCSGS